LGQRAHDAGKAVQDRVDRHDAQFERRCPETPQVRLDAVRQLARAALFCCRATSPLDLARPCPSASDRDLRSRDS
jgi:hypothetical protein